MDRGMGWEAQLAQIGKPGLLVVQSTSIPPTLPIMIYYYQVLLISNYFVYYVRFNRCFYSVQHTMLIYINIDFSLNALNSDKYTNQRPRIPRNAREVIFKFYSSILQRARLNKNVVFTAQAANVMLVRHLGIFPKEWTGKAHDCGI